MPRKSEHPGIKLKAPRLGCSEQCERCAKCKSDERARQPYWQASWVDPDTKKTCSLKLEDDVLKLYSQNLVGSLARERAAKAWAIKKSKDVSRRQAEVDSGAPTATGMNIEAGFALFLASKSDCSPRTLGEFNAPFRHFKKWAEKTKTTYDTLTRSRLDDVRTYVYGAPAQRRKKGGKRGEMADSDEQRSAITVNGDLVAIGSLLRYLRNKNMLPKANTEDIAWGLRKYDFELDPPEWMPPPEIMEVIAAADDHDADTFVMTRDDKRDLGESKDSPKGTTPRNKPVRAYLYGALMSGMRHDELSLVTFETHVNLTTSHWGDVPIGEIALRKQDTKTRKARGVSFEVSPLLRRMVVALGKINGDKGPVFDLTYDEASDAMQRLRETYGAPKRFTWQLCRSTCDTYLCNSKGIYHAAATQLAAAQIGHSVQVAQDYYVGLIKGGIPAEFKTLEAAMRIEAPFRKYVEELEAEAAAIERSSNVVSLRERRRAPKHGGGRKKATVRSAQQET